MVSFSKKCLTAKSTYILPLFFASNFYFFTQKKRIARKINIGIEDYKKELTNLNENNNEFFKKFNDEFLALNKMMGESFLSYIFSVFYFFKISKVNFGKEWAFLSLNRRKIILSYKRFCLEYKEGKERSLVPKEKPNYYTNELISNFLKKLFLDFLILSCYFYPKLCKSRSLSFGLHMNLFINFFIKILQPNRITFLTKLFLINNSENIEKLKKEFQKTNIDIDSLIRSEKKKLIKNIFYQNLFFIPIVNQVALAHYSFKNYPSHLICFPGFCLLALSNHFFYHFVASRFFKNSFHKFLPQLPLLFFDFFIFYHYFMQCQESKKQKEEKNRLLPGEQRIAYYEDRFVTEVCDLNGKITTITEYYQPT